MTGAEQTYVQVIATILVGTFIAYSVDLRHEARRTVDVELNRLHRGLGRAALIYEDSLPILTSACLLIVIVCAGAGSLPSWALIVLNVGTTLSVVALALGTVTRRVDDYRQRKERR